MDLGYHRKYTAFNKQVTEKRFNEIRDLTFKVLSNFKYDVNKKYSENWKQVTNTQWIELSNIPEFDKSVVEGIIGFTLDLESKETIVIGGITYDKNEVENQLKNLKPIK